MYLQKHIILIFILLLLSLNTKAQNNIDEFYFEVNTARKLVKNGNIDSAITTYENAFKKINYVQNIYLKRVLKLGKLNKDKQREEKYTKQIEKQSKGTNSQLKAIVDSLMILDQKVRKGKCARKARYAMICDYKQKGNKKSKRYKKSKMVLDNWKKTDFSNTQCLLTLFKKYGFLGEELLGERNANDVFVILLHFDQDTNNIILGPVLEKARTEGKINLIDFALIQDRHLGGDYTIQKYWMWPYIGKEKLQFTEEEVPEIIKLRESIGLFDTYLEQVKDKRGNWKLDSGFN